MVQKKDRREARVQTGLRLETRILNRLRNNSKRSLSEEIRDRLERTFKEDAIDPVTRELCEGLVNVSELLRDDFGEEWHAWPPAHQTFAAAIAQRIAGYAPPPGVMMDAASNLLGPNYPPETLGRIRERDDQRAHTYRHLADAQKRTAVGFTGHVRTKKENKDE